MDAATDCVDESMACDDTALTSCRSLFCGTSIMEAIADRVKSSGFVPGWNVAFAIIPLTSRRL